VARLLMHLGRNVYVSRIKPVRWSALLAVLIERLNRAEEATLEGCVCSARLYHSSSIC
jgi:hypothetical protein